jgi:plasmid stabilization system protein ParE
LIRQTLSAERQATAMFRSYLRKERYEAFRRFDQAIQDAVREIEADPHAGALFPRPYPELARWGFRWIKVHRYWFAWSMAKGYPVVTNILYDQARIWRRVAGDEDDDMPI